MAREDVEPGRAGREHAAGDLVGDLGGRDVDDAGEEARVGELFHRATADAGGVEDEAVVGVLETLGHRLDAGRRDAEHRQADRGLGVGRGGHGVGDHAGQGVCGIGQDLLADPVDPLDVGDRIHHADVARADVGPGVAARHGRDHHLGHAHGEGAHALRCQRRAARAAGGDQATEVAPGLDEGFEGERHRRHRIAAVAAEDGRFALRMMARHLARMDACRRGLAGGREIDGDDPQPKPLEALAQEEELAALGVEGAGDIGGARAAGGHREFEHLRRGCGGSLRRGGRCDRRAARDVGHRSGRAAGVPAVEAAHRRRREVVERRRAVAMGAAHGQHLHRRRRLVAPVGLRLGLRLEAVTARAHPEQPLLQIAVDGELRGRHLLGDAAVDHHADAVGDRHRHAEVLLDQEDGNPAFGGKRAQRLGDLVDDHRRQAFGRLVHDEQLGPQQESAPDREHLLLAARKLGAAVGAPLRQAREHRIDAVDLALARCDQAQRLVDRERRPDAAALRHVGDAAPGDLVRCAAEDLLADQPHAAAGRHQAGDGVAERRLAHAVAADDAEHAAFEREADALERMGAAVVHVEALDHQHRAGVGGVVALAAAEPGHQCLLPM